MSQPLILIQARNGGSRLPGKVNMLIGDRRMLDIVIARVRLSGLKWMLCRAEDYREIAEEDVLGRFQAALEHIDPLTDAPIWEVVPNTQGKWVQQRESPAYDPILRVTADCPLWESQIAHWALAAFQARTVDLVGTGPEWDGLDVEVISRAALARAERATQPIPRMSGEAARWLARAREHVTTWARWNGTLYLLPPPPSPLRFSVDDQEGLTFVRRVFSACALCSAGVPHHSNAAGSIGGSDRRIIWDLHEGEGGGLAECCAYDILRERIGGEVYRSL